MSRLSDLFSRIGEGRWRKTVIFAGIAAMVLLFLSTLEPENKSEQQPQNYSMQEMAQLEKELEQRLTAIISGIDGVASPKVMVTLECTSRRVFAEETKSSSTADEVKNESSVALSGSGKEAIETSVIMPQVRGVAVVCGGAENVLIKEKVVNTAARVLNIGISQVYVTN